MNYTIFFSIIAFLILNGGQTHGQPCFNEPPIPYNYGANWRALPALVNPNPASYIMQHTNADQFGTDFVHSATIRDLNTNISYIKVHQLNPTNATVRDIKYAYPAGPTIPSGFNFGNHGAVVMRTTQDDLGHHYLMGGFLDRIGTINTYGLIKRFDVTNATHRDLYLQPAGFPNKNPPISSTYTMITKMIKASDGYFYAVGTSDYSVASATRSAVIFKIHPSFFDQSITSCTSPSCSLIEAKTIRKGMEHFLSDIIEYKGEIYFGGGFISRAVRPAGGGPSIFSGGAIIGRWSDGHCHISDFGLGSGIICNYNQLKVYDDRLYGLFTDHHSHVGGIIEFQNIASRLQIVKSHEFELDKMLDPSSPIIPPLSNANTIFTTMDIVDDDNILIGGYMSPVPAIYRSFVLNYKPNYNPSNGLANSKANFNTFGYLENQSSLDIEPLFALKKGWSYPCTNFSVFSRINNDVFLASSIGNAVGHTGGTVKNFNLNDLVNYGTLNSGICNEMEIAYALEPHINHESLEFDFLVPITVHAMSSIDPEGDFGVSLLKGEDYKFHCSERIQSDLDQTACVYFEKLEAFKPSSSSTPLASLSNISLCQGQCLKLKVKERLALGNKRFEWYKDNNLIVGATNCELDICGFDGGTYEVRCFHEESTGECMASFTASIQPAYHDAIVASPSADICQGVPVTLSVNNSNIATYNWMRFPDNLGTSSSITTSSPGHYTVDLTYTNGCVETAEIDLQQKDLTMSMFAANTSSTLNDVLNWDVFNYNTNAVNGITLKINLDPTIFNPNPLPTGWSNVGPNQFEYYIPTINGAASNTSPGFINVQLPITATNKCPVSIISELSTTDPTVTCPPIIQGTEIWKNNNHTPALTTNMPITCTGQNITVNATPTGATNYVWFEDNVTHTYFGNTATQVINYVASRHLYESDIEVQMTRNQCTKRSPKLRLGFSRMPTITGVVTHKSCNPANVMGSIDVTVVPALNYTYAWFLTGSNSPIATTQDISNIFPLNGSSLEYMVVVRDPLQCAFTSVFTVNNTTPMQANIQRILQDCTIPGMDIIKYIANVSGGTPPYTYTWYTGSSSNTSANNFYISPIAPSSVEVTDANGCKNIFPIIPHTTGVHTITATSDVAIFNTSFTNSIIKLPHNFTITKPWTLTNCDLVFTTQGGQMTIASPSSNQAGLRLINSTVHTCGNFMARGIVMTKTGDYVYPTGSTFEDMFAAIAIEPINGHTMGNFYLPLEGNTFKNNYSGIRISDPDAISIDQRRTNSSQSPMDIFWTNNTFIGSNNIKPYHPAAFPASLSHLEPLVFNATNTSSSYAGYIGNYKGQLYFLNSGFTSPAAPLPTFFTNLANAILTHNGKIGIHNAKFENIQSSNANLLHNGNAVYAKGQNLSNQGIYIQGYGTWSSDFDDLRHAIQIQDMHLTLWGTKMSNISERGVGIFLTSSVPNRYIDIQGNQIDARIPIHAELQNNHTMKIVNNQLSDIIPLNGTANTDGALVNVLGANGTISSGIVDGIANNILTVNYSRYGIRMNSINGISSAVRYPIANNNIKILNSTPTFTHAGMQILNANNYNLTGNIIHMATGSQIATTPGTITSPALPTNSAPIGIWTENIQNLQLSCNSFYTRTGSFHNNSHINFELLTNNYATKDHGVIFRNFGGGSVIRGMSNKFYCGLPSANFMRRISGGANPPINVSFGGATPITIPTTCGSLLPYCSSNPPGTPFYSYYPFPLNTGGNTGYTLLTAPSPDNSCAIYCNLPKIAQAMPAQNGLEPNAVLYPNPSTGSFRIKLENMESDIEQIDVEILDMQGRVVYQEANSKVNKQETAIETKLNAGYYLVRIYDGSGLNLTKKLMIE